MGKRTAVLGGGVMGSTLMRSVIAAGHPDVVVIEKNPERVQELVRDYHVTAGPELELMRVGQHPGKLSCDRLIGVLDRGRRGAFSSTGDGLVTESLIRFFRN